MGCQNITDNTEEIGEQLEPNKSEVKNEFSTEDDGVVVKANINQQTFEKDENIIVSATVSNEGKEPYEYQGSSTCSDWIYFQIEGNQKGTYFTGEGDIQPIECTADLHPFVLEPDENLTAEATFNLEVKSFETNNVKNAESGDYLLAVNYGDIVLEIPITIK